MVAPLCNIINDMRLKLMALWARKRNSSTHRPASSAAEKHGNRHAGNRHSSTGGMNSPRFARHSGVRTKSSSHHCRQRRKVRRGTPSPATSLPMRGPESPAAMAEANATTALNRRAARGSAPKPAWCDGGRPRNKRKTAAGIHRQRRTSRRVACSAILNAPRMAGSP